MTLKKVTDGTHCGKTFFIDKLELEHLIAHLTSSGYTVVGPKVEDNVIVYAEINNLADLPQGYREEQSGGQYRLSKSPNSNYFEFNLGPHSWKHYLFPPEAVLASAKRSGNRWEFDSSTEENGEFANKFAFLGVRACELAAIGVQDRVFAQGTYVDPIYCNRRSNSFLIAVNCTTAAATCFCTSMGTGPSCSRERENEFDLALTELDTGFLIEIGSEKGAAVAELLNSREPNEIELQAGKSLLARAVSQISKQLNTTNLRDILFNNLEHQRWDEVASRCLACTNCTQVCPTCFCSTVTDVTDLTGEQIERTRHWDSCFNLDFAYMVGGTVRNDRRSRFRQWLVHKLASWHDQFDMSGCVGCGRCITWCPVGIDLTEEVYAIRNTPPSKRSLPVQSSDQSKVCAVGKVRS